MAKRTYEGMFLLDSNRYARDPAGVSRQISEMLEKLGADVLVSRLWSEQKLAYHIKGHRKGAYWLTFFRMDGPQLVKLKRESQLNHNVLRSLFLTVDERLADTLVQHATGTTTDSDAAPKDVAAEKPEAKTPEAETPEAKPDAGNQAEPASTADSATVADA